MLHFQIWLSPAQITSGSFPLELPWDPFRSNYLWILLAWITFHGILLAWITFGSFPPKSPYFIDYDQIFSIWSLYGWHCIQVWESSTCITKQSSPWKFKIKFQILKLNISKLYYSKVLDFKRYIQYFHIRRVTKEFHSHQTKNILELFSTLYDQIFASWCRLVV